SDVYDKGKEKKDNIGDTFGRDYELFNNIFVKKPEKKIEDLNPLPELEEKAEELAEKAEEAATTLFNLAKVVFVVAVVIAWRATG
ncbi:MAG: hypothetical protein KAS32_00805, partial [Candidatus Peribacteraceae bacterium]|nr:hypothetical protein [Candidatus Peribacteraceae bacterium]